MSEKKNSGQENSEEQEDSEEEEQEKQVNFRVSKDQKEDWEDFVETESDYLSLSHFLRKSAQKEISGRHNDSQEQGSEFDNSPSPEVMEKLEEISNQLDELGRRISVLEADQYRDEKISELTTEIYQILPTSEEEISYGLISRGVVEQEGVDPDSLPYNRLKTTGSVQDLAEVLDASEAKVEQAIEQLKEDTNIIDESERDGETHYYRVE